MKNIIEKACFLAFYVFLPCLSLAQADFSGSFLMSFESTGSEKQEPSLSWNVHSTKSDHKMVMEIKDEMNKKGVSKRVLFDPADSTWIMMMAYNNVKQAVRVHASSMFRDSVPPKKVVFKKTNIEKVIEGYKCKKYTLESENYFSEIWVTEQVEFNLNKVYTLLSHCGMTGDLVRKGDWFRQKKIRGMILEVRTTNKSTGSNYTVKITQIKSGIIEEALFKLTGFRISDIPEGQNCGAVLEKD